MIAIDFWLQVLVLALLFDIFFGEPPSSVHPVVWMGNLINFFVIRALELKKDLEEKRIEKVRNDLRTFVGRDTSGLNEHQSASAVIESLAESFVDGILSPLFYFLIFGLPGALAYRMINTLDSMVGYKKEPFIDLGYAPARLDDLANWAPARISLIFILIASVFF